MVKKSSIFSIKSVPLDQKFWSEFSSKYWEKKHLQVKNFKSSLQKMDEAAVFKLLVSYSDQCRKNKNPKGFKFYIHGMQTSESDILQILPDRKDKNFLGYHARMQKMFSDYCLVCDELLSVESDQRSALTEFTDALHAHVGIPNRFSEMGLYLGNYQKTPFGVHVDHCGVFSFPVVGEKKFRLWTSEFVKKNPSLDRAFKYEKHKKNSQILTAGPGDMTYWPSSAWHIAESDGAFSATWSLGVWVDRTHGKVFSEGVADLLRKKNRPSDQLSTTRFKTLHESTGEVKQLPQTYLDSILNLKKITTDELTDYFFQSWVRHISQKGLKTFPQSQIQIKQDSRIRLHSLNTPILWFLNPSNRTHISYCFAGVAVSSKLTQGLKSLILRLNKGETCLVRDFLKGAMARHDLMILRTLAETGAFVEFN